MRQEGPERLRGEIPWEDVPMRHAPAPGPCRDCNAVPEWRRKARALGAPAFIGFFELGDYLMGAKVPLRKDLLGAELLVRVAGAERGRSPRARSRKFGALVTLSGVVLALTFGVVSAKDPMALTRVAARHSATRAGAEYLGKRGVVLQKGLHDCGPAALANLALLLGLPAPSLDSLAVLSGTQASGTRASGLVRAATALGITLEADRVGSDQLRALRTPFIAWLHQSHFVTVEKWTSQGQLVVLDSQVGRYALHERAFLPIWSGEVLRLHGATSPPSAPQASAFHS